MAQDVYVRLPTGLHGELRRRAAEQGVSLNQLCVALLAGGVGFKLDEEADLRCEHCGSALQCRVCGIFLP